MTKKVDAVTSIRIPEDLKKRLKEKFGGREGLSKAVRKQFIELLKQEDKLLEKFSCVFCGNKNHYLIEELKVTNLWNEGDISTQFILCPDCMNHILKLTEEELKLNQQKHLIKLLFTEDIREQEELCYVLIDLLRYFPEDYEINEGVFTYKDVTPEKLCEQLQKINIIKEK